MGLFSAKPAQPDPDDAQAAADAIFDEQYRDELRQIGREHVKHMLEEATKEVAAQLAPALQQVTGDIKEHMTRQLDVSVAQLNADITTQLNERINEYRRLATEAQEQASQSLRQNVEAVHEKYLQFTSTLQQTLTSHEVMMITTLEDNKARVNAAQQEQDRVMKSLHDNAERTRQQAEELSASMQKSVNDQASLLTNIYHENIARVSATKDAQESAYATMRDSIQALKQHYEQFNQLLDQAVADHKARLVDNVNQNMARVVEHYVVGALGEQSDIRAQLPAIIAKLEESKAAMTEDMKL